MYMNAVESGTTMKNRGIISFIHREKLYSFLIAVSLFIISGCSKYQLVYLNSHLQKDEKEEFITENDTVRIKYAFTGENLLLSLTIYNKLPVPLYIDYQRSTVVINNEQTGGAFDQNNQVSFIAPLSYVTMKSNPLRDSLFRVGTKDPMIVGKTRTSQGLNYSYNEDTTPFYLRCILAITPNEDFSYPTFYDYSFWVSDIIQTYNNPKSLSYKPSNRFYMKKETGVGRTMSITGSVLLLIVLYGLGAGGE